MKTIVMLLIALALIGCDQGGGSPPAPIPGATDGAPPPPPPPPPDGADGESGQAPPPEWPEHMVGDHPCTTIAMATGVGLVPAPSVYDADIHVGSLPNRIEVSWQMGPKQWQWSNYGVGSGPGQPTSLGEPHPLPPLGLVHYMYRVHVPNGASVAWAQMRAPKENGIYGMGSYIKYGTQVANPLMNASVHWTDIVGEGVGPGGAGVLAVAPTEPGEHWWVFPRSAYGHTVDANVRYSVAGSTQMDPYQVELDGLSWWPVAGFCMTDPEVS